MPPRPPSRATGGAGPYSSGVSGGGGGGGGGGSNGNGMGSNSSRGHGSAKASTYTGRCVVGIRCLVGDLIRYMGEWVGR